MEPLPQTPSSHGTPAAEAAENRRGFLAQAVTLVLSAVALLVPAAIGMIAFLNPLRQKSRAGEFMRVTSLEMLPEGGPPQIFPVIADRTDAWNRFPNEPIGAVFLRRTGKDQVEAINVICPHAGCPIQYHGEDEKDEKKRNRFACPCHKAVFELTSERILPSDSPRNLDTLEVRIENGTDVLVKFQSFQAGISRKTAKA